MSDVSKTIIVVLLVLTILVSVVGTWFVLNTLDNAIAKASSAPSKSYGQVNVRVVEPGSEYYTAGGKVSVNVQRPPA